MASEAAEIAENIVAALLDVNEGLIYASSRRYLTHAVIGAISLAEQDQRRPTFEDMQRLLEPAQQELRDQAGQACSQIPDLDATAHFLQEELPNDLRIAGSQTAMRLLGRWCSGRVTWRCIWRCSIRRMNISIGRTLSSPTCPWAQSTSRMSRASMISRRVMFVG